MSNTQHTPGPWFLNLDSDDCPDGKISVESAGYYIAQVDECKRQVANARLIAAAPELLEALLDVAAGYNDPELFLPQVRGAIAKARGE